MPYTLQVRDARASLQLKKVAGVCSGSDEFLSLLNEAQRRLNKRGNFFDTEQLVRFCVYNGCITWPRFVGTVLGIRFCHCTDFSIRNNWYAIMGPHGCSGFRATHTMRDNGTAPIYNQITGEGGKYIRVVLQKNTDIGKTITLFGTDANGQPLQQKIGGVWQRGLTLTMAKPYVQTAIKVKTITSVVRAMTEANVTMWEFDDVSATLRDLAVYEPTETHPRYRQSIIDRFDCIPSSCAETDGVRFRSFDALVKLNFIEAVNEWDFLAIDDFDALKLMIQAARHEEANEEEMAEAKILKAIRELNYGLRDKSPGEQTTIRINPVGRPIYNPI